ncbi:nucleoside phosphorylase [Alkalitalea saponilacus]|uniref:Uridine phosphorylase n=1 Tax=Alkalitalea saponilacus TaxID=889453 RepID=A0A1T5HRR3_9BACT|nr:nucleoside phosphorylase [Alkalitalea saponilacus]ASB50070.1 phosphorylase [Alkalitalea saponilacus]SKC23403.1 uridine phosphorylase [Alkalitalea saponilacus]
MERIAESELIINPDGSVFHLHIKPGELSDRVILVGDPGRVESVAAFFDKVDFEGGNREFVWKTGVYQGKSFTVLSSGIGTDNIDIVLNELDALVNVDFSTRIPKKEHKSLKIVRIGTSGSLQADLPVDTWLLSEKAIGFDGLLNFYERRDEVSDLKFEESFVKSVGFQNNLSAPYVVNGEDELLKQLDSNAVIKGVTISAPGFYGPQGRVIRLPLAMKDINERITAFRYNDFRITNYEMECSAIYGLSALLGHQAATVCAIIANRLAGTYSKDYKVVVNRLIEYVLNALAK